ncbi:MAG: AAA family ATPase [Actinomycetota bacterium]|nr:AAA family ATPase [Actinomycetota bacterium]
MRDLRCPVMVGREDELEHLVTAIEQAAGGGGKAVLLLGEAGVGKSRLGEVAAAAARSRGMAVLRGRAAPSPAPAPYRPLAEALLSALRTGGERPVPDTPGLRAALGVVVPAWSDEELPAPAEPSLVLLGEAVLSVLRALGGPAGLFVLLEDLHWADPGTLELLDYLVDKLDGTKAVVVATIRAGEGSAAEEQARSLQARRQAAAVELDRLPPTDLARMVSASLGAEDVPGELVSVVQDASDGLPFLIEEVLGSLVGTEALVREQGRWQVRGPLRPAVPPSLATAVQERMARLSPTARRVVQAAAVLGDHFDWSLLRCAAEGEDEEIVAALRQAAHLQLVEEDAAGTGFRFRHALTRAAVAGTLLPPERAAVAERALAALDVDETGDAGRLGLAAQLAETAGRHRHATDLLLASASAALRQGALSSASASAERVLAGTPGPEQTLAALRILLDASVLAGNLPRASEVGDALLARLDAVGAPPRRRAEVRLRLAESCVAATDWRGTGEHLSRSAALLPTGGDDLAARHRLLQARAALGQHRPEAAADHVRAGLEVAERLHRDDLLCESLELMGRVDRALDLGHAERWFTQALVAAERSGSRLGQARCLLELGIIDLFRLGPTERLRAAEERAAEIGAPALAAQAALHLGILLSFRFEVDEARAAARRAHESALRYGLGLLVPAAAVVVAATDAYLGRQGEAVAAFERARPLMDVDIEVTGRQVLGLAALAVEDRAAALDELGRAHALCPDSRITRSPFRPVLALLFALEGDAPPGALEGLDATSVHVVPTAVAGLARAVLAGREGDHAAAERLFWQADTALAPAPWFRMMGRRLVAEAAMAHGWGSPGAWLGEAQDFFAGAGLDEPARACRSLSRLAGSGAPRRRSAVEPELERAGVTPREADVLALVAGGLTNKEIAERLYLSARTVEKHVERLLLKTGAPNRARLAALASRLQSSRT